MAAKSPVDKLNSAISKMLDEYAGEIGENIGKIAEEMGKKGAQALRQSSKQNLKQHSGNYAKGWKSQVEHGRMSTTVTIYNEHPALAHLLEYGHVTRNGTDRTFPRTPAHEHIAPVAEELVETYEREVIEKL